MLRGVWQALNCLSIDATYCVIVAGASPGETKMWAAVRENGDFLSASLYFSKRGAYWDRLCREVVGRWLVVTRVHCSQTVHPKPIVTMEH